MSFYFILQDSSERFLQGQSGGYKFTQFLFI